MLNRISLKIQLSHRFASISQFASIVSLLDITGNNPKTILNNDYNLIKYDSLYHGLLSIQFNIFMITLGRKNILSRRKRSLIYLFHIFLIIMFSTPIQDPIFISSILLVIIGRFGLNINKYLLYSGIYIFNNILINYYDKKILYTLFILSGASIIKTIHL